MITLPDASSPCGNRPMMACARRLLPETVSPRMVKGRPALQLKGKKGSTQLPLGPLTVAASIVIITFIVIRFTACPCLPSVERQHHEEKGRDRLQQRMRRFLVIGLQFNHHGPQFRRWRTNAS